MCYVYIIRNSAGHFYTGHTEDIDARLANHNRSDKVLGKFTRKNGPWTLVWTEEHVDRASAIRREREIKNWKSARSIRTRLLGLKE
jgi:predicted GIY-YIG superfamily endonuclease